MKVYLFFKLHIVDSAPFLIFVHQIKKAANVPSFVLEFLLSKYCATDDPDEIKAGSKAVLEVVEKNYVRRKLII